MRDDAETVGPLLKKLRPHVDQIVCVDTGSTDDSPAICRDIADVWTTYLGCNDPATELIEDFADARNHALSLASHTWHLWVDADDDFQGAENLRTLCDRPEEAVQYLVPYEYTHDAAGRCTCLHWRENLVKPRDKLRWQIPVHEVLLPSIPMQIIQPTQAIRRIHRKELSKRAPDPQRNLRILEKYVARVGETDVRALYYYGVELHHTPGRIGDAIRVLKRYVQLSRWPDEKCLAQLELARIYQGSIRDHETAIHWAFEAMGTKSWPEPYWAIVRSLCALVEQGIDTEYNVKRAMHWAERGLQLPDTETVLFVNPLERFEIHYYLNALYARTGQIEKALASVREGLKGLPDDPELRKRELLFEDFLTKNSFIGQAQKLRAIKDQTVAIGAFDAAQWKAVGDAVGQLLEIQPPAALPAFEREVPEQPKGDGCLDIVFYLGQAYERWTPVTLATGGMGGSETMAWELARRLRKIGHRVRVFADCEAEQEGVYDGVEWLMSHRYVGTRCDVMISSRRPDAVEDAAQLNARATCLWLHDCHAGNFTKVQALRFDRILALSQWHKDYLLAVYGAHAPHPICQLHPDDIHVTRNGIDPDHFDAEGPRNPKRVVYSSSPDRGLTTLLEMWPAILAEEPEAELHCFYGLENWEKATAMNQYGDHPFLSGTALRRLKHQLRSAKRVTMHGRVGPDRLTREFLCSGVWAYPTWFCCHGDTRISVPGDHRGGAPTVRIKDMVGKSGFPVYAFNEAENRFELRTALRVWETKIATELVALELDSGETLRVTPDHKVLTFDGDWIEAGALKEGDSLRALHYRYNVAIRDGNGRWANEHRLVGEWKEGRRLRRDEHVDHADPIRLDNRPESLTVMSAVAHGSKTHKGKRLSKKHIEKKRLASMAAVAAMSPERKAEWHRLGNKRVWESIRAKPVEEQKAFFARRVATRKANRAAARALQLPYEAREGHNHKVVRVTRLTEPTPVYDMEVEGLHNFVAEGVVVHNCETSCITAMQAQAAGCFIVATPVAALNETVANRAIRVPGNWENPTQFERAEFVLSVVKAIRGEGQQRTREQLQLYARENFGLEELAADWDRELRELVECVDRDVVKRFR